MDYDISDDNPRFKGFQCYVCGKDGKISKSLLCTEHKMAWDEYTSQHPAKDRLFLREWAITYGAEHLCPSCERNLLPDDDYVCEECRYG
jgi:hypothetical protein